MTAKKITKRYVGLRLLSARYREAPLTHLSAHKADQGTKPV